MIDGIQTVRIVAVQRRKHRKRRINKNGKRNMDSDMTCIMEKNWLNVMLN